MRHDTTSRIQSILLACAFGILSSWFAAPAASIAEPEVNSGALTTGEKLFVQYCASCHGPKADGTGPVAPIMVVEPANLQKIAARRGGTFPAADVSAIIDGRTEITAHGTRAMPIWGQKFAAEFGSDQIAEEAARGKIAAIVDYLQSVQVKADD